MMIILVLLTDWPKETVLVECLKMPDRVPENQFPQPRVHVNLVAQFSDDQEALHVFHVNIYQYQEGLSSLDVCSIKPFYLNFLSFIISDTAY
jgi:hypothetical protein